MLRIGLLLAFLAVPVLEIWLVIQIAQVIGGWLTVGLLIAGTLVGVRLVLKEGRQALGALQAAVGSGRSPDRELADGGMIMAGGALLLIPGFVTDLLGFLFVLPFTRPLARRGLGWVLHRWARLVAARSPYGGLPDGLSDRLSDGGPDIGSDGGFSAGRPSAGRPADGRPGAGNRPGSRPGNVIRGEVIDREDFAER